MYKEIVLAALFVLALVELAGWLVNLRLRYWRRIRDDELLKGEI